MQLVVAGYPCRKAETGSAEVFGEIIRIDRKKSEDVPGVY
jgi:hypothetical protein